MDTIRLEDIIPEGATFTLRKTGKTYRLNPVNLSDELWMSNTFGERLDDIFKNIRMKDICRIVFRLMDEDDKQDFAAKDVAFMNEEGETLEKRMGGAELLFVLVSGYAEKIEIFQALLTTIGVSRPMQEALEEADAEGGEKKSQLKQTGQQPSTSSRMSTVGQRLKSSPAPRKKLRTESKRSSTAGRMK